MAEKKQRARSGPTSVDVARKAGVSQATVSYVLNETQNTHASAEVRARVRQAAQELGYSIHPAARTLRKGKSDEIGLIDDMPASMYQTEMFVPMQQRAFFYRLNPVVYFQYGLPEAQTEALFQRIFSRRPVGLIATTHSMTEERVAQARKSGIEHIVLISSKAVTYAHTIVLPAFIAGQLAAQHLLAHGHRHLALIQPEDPLTAHGFQQRLLGMRVVLSRRPEIRLDILPMHLSLAGACACVDAMLSASDHPTGLYTYNDEYALPLLRVLGDRGLRVPQDVALLGTDNIALGEFLRPALTTIQFDTHSIGQRAIDVLVTLHQGLPVPEELTYPLLPEVIQREST